MEGQVDDIEKAHKMAEAEKPWRDRARSKDINYSEDVKRNLDQTAENKGKWVGEEYDREQQYEKRQEEKRKLRILEEPKKEGGDVSLPERFNVEELVSAGVKLVSILRFRESDGMAPLIIPEAISTLRSGFMEVEEGAHSKIVDSVLGGLDKIRSALEQLGQAPSVRAVKESSDSLTKVVFALKSVQDGVLSLKSLELDVTLTMKINTIADIAQKKWLVISKKRDLIRSYEGGRH
ncbi:MAG TPA: hypothetical protein VJC14_00140 [Candidatus Paceibacterota bacterium]